MCIWGRRLAGPVSGFSDVVILKIKEKPCAAIAWSFRKDSPKLKAMVSERVRRVWR